MLKNKQFLLKSILNDTGITIYMKKNNKYKKKKSYDRLSDIYIYIYMK